jgi:hypothetical protein
VLDYHFRSFAHQVVPRLVKEGVAVLGMKHPCLKKVSNATSGKAAGVVRRRAGRFSRRAACLSAKSMSFGCP